MARPRRPLKFWAMAAFTTLAILLGLVLLILGPDGETRLTGLMCLLLFGLGGLGYLGGPLLTRRGAGTVLRSRVETSAGSEAAFVFPTPPGKRIAMTIGAFGMAGGCVILLILSGGGAVLIACTAVFVLFFVLLVLSARRPQQLALTPTRVVSTAGLGTVELPWEAVDDVEVYEMPAGRANVDMLGVAAIGPDAAIWTRGRLLGRLGRRFSPFDLSVGADTFAGEAERVVEAIRRYRDDPERRRSIGGEQEHARLMREIGETPAPA